MKWINKMNKNNTTTTNQPSGFQIPLIPKSRNRVQTMIANKTQKLTELKELQLTKMATN